MPIRIAAFGAGSPNSSAALSDDRQRRRWDMHGVRLPGRIGRRVGADTADE
jgi:hypothetical protein